MKCIFVEEFILILCKSIALSSWSIKLNFLFLVAFIILNLPSFMHILIERVHWVKLVFLGHKFSYIHFLIKFLVKLGEDFLVSVFGIQFLLCYTHRLKRFLDESLLFFHFKVAIQGFSFASFKGNIVYSSLLRFFGSTKILKSFIVLESKVRLRILHILII